MDLFEFNPLANSKKFSIVLSLSRFLYKTLFFRKTPGLIFIYDYKNKK